MCHMLLYGEGHEERGGGVNELGREGSQEPPRSWGTQGAGDLLAASHCLCHEPRVTHEPKGCVKKNEAAGNHN